MASGKKSFDAFEAALKREIRSASTSKATDCPAPEILAAYYDRSLSRGERARFDLHLTLCARCQSMMASIARADDSVRALAPESSRSVFWITRLLAPGAVVGVLIAIAIGMRTRKQPAPELIALASPAALPAREVAAEPQAPAAPRAAGVTESKKAEGAVRAGNAATSMRAETFGAAVQGQYAADQAARAMRAPNLTPRSALSGATNSIAKAPPPMKQISSPDGSTAWQFGPLGTIMRSVNSGVWLPQHSGTTIELVAGSAPSNDVCWIVGKTGVILRTRDSGSHWQVVNPPARADFTVVSASDSNNASISAADGESFTTRDGGATWSSP